MNSFCLVAVNCFVLISGYYLCQSKPNYKRIIPLWIQVFTYSVGIYLVLCLFPSTGIQFSIRGLMEHGLPMLTNQYWFFKYYVLLLVISPFLNQLIATLERTQYKQMLLVLFILFSAIPSVNIFGDTFGASSGYSLIWFVVLYLSAGYLRKYPIKKRPWFRMYLCCGAVICGMRVFAGVLGGVFATVSGLQRGYNAPLVWAASVFLFLCSLNGPQSYGLKMDILIKEVSGLSFAVYLLHDHGAISNLLWNEWINLAQAADSGIQFISRAGISLLLIFSCGILTEYILNAGYRFLCRLFIRQH